ncbi:TrkA family potassium uptake protein [Planctomycetota bacterium]|nr:TrkA family potassium uptake protein [Planctomycetota bacterium]
MQKVAVIGLGRFGLALAEKLAHEGLEVIAIDNDGDVINAVKDKVALAVKADGTSKETLQSLGLGKVDTVVVAIGDHFENCQLAMMAARDLNFPAVIARANDRRKATILRALGADEVLMPEEQAALKLATKLAKPSLLDAMDLGTEHSFVQVRVPTAVIGKTLIELNLRVKFGVNVVALLEETTGDKKHAKFRMAGADTMPQDGETLLMVGKNDDIDRFIREME